MDIVTPVNADELERLLKLSNYDPMETKFLVDGFRRGFSIDYQGEECRKDYAENIPFRSVGSSEELWEKLMKEVNLKRYVGLFKQVPFNEFVQSPIELVPKAGGKTRLIFHLSYDFPKSGNKSINKCTPKESCLVKYNNLDAAVKLSWELLQTLGKNQTIYFGKNRFVHGFSYDSTVPRLLQVVSYEGGKSRKWGDILFC